MEKKNYLTDESKEKLRISHLGNKNPNYNPNITHEGKYERNDKTKKIRLKKTYSYLPGENSNDGRKSIEFRTTLRLLKTGKNNPNYGKHSWNYGKKMTEKQKEKIYESWTDERRMLVSQQHMGNKNPQAKKVLCITTGIIYDTIVEAAKMNNVSERTVSECCNNKRKNPKIKFAFVKEGDQK